ncbi:MAG TPA: glycosyl hydrolase-related protein, partial [Phototrophicaceae bacterium]|nr:glycosyl hydrolase-related protein [Phototrophicaceae bacterium]
PHEGAFDEAQAHRFGLEAANSVPVVQHMGEQAAASTPLPASGGLLTFPALPVITTHVKEAADGDGLIVRLLNASDQAQTAQIGSALLTITGAQQCDLLENEQSVLVVNEGAVSVEVPPRRVVVVALQTKAI